MPLVYVFTNLKESSLKEGIEPRIAQTVADVLVKPLERISVIIVPGVRLLRIHTTEPACTVHIHAVNVFDKERNPKYTPVIKQLLKDELGLQPERICIIYHDLDFDFFG